MNSAPPGPHIGSVAELLAHAYHMEREAQARYTYLAEQMEIHNNTQLADLFRKLADVEAIHAKDILRQMQEMNVPELSPSEAVWSGGEAPESVDMADASYMMTPHQALQMALHAERRAHDFFEQLRTATDDVDVERFAAEFAEEEREHVDLVLAELKKYPVTDGQPRDDMDPPIAQG